MRRQIVWWGVVSCILLVSTGCAAPPAPTPTAPPTATQTATLTLTPTSTGVPSPTGATPTPDPAERLRVEVLAAYPHDPAAFTQGLVFDEGRLYESTGQYGASTLREVIPETGEVVRSIDLPAKYFGEGLALVDGRLIQITWREGEVFFYDKATFEQQAQMNYEGEGWGLCFDGQSLYMSDGSSLITVRSPGTFQAENSIMVVHGSRPVEKINELECAGGDIYANVWHTDDILRIDKATGQVTAVIDASGLLTPEEQAAAGKEDVLNGIAYDPARDVFLITGKRWPKLFEVRFVPDGG